MFLEPVSNDYFVLGSGFPGSENGRIVRVYAPEGSFVQYDITQKDLDPTSWLDFWVSFSDECSGRINGGEQHYCNISNDKVPEPSLPATELLSEELTPPPSNRTE